MHITFHSWHLSILTLITIDVVLLNPNSCLLFFVGGVGKCRGEGQMSGGKRRGWGGKCWNTVETIIVVRLQTPIQSIKIT